MPDSWIYAIIGTAAVCAVCSSLTPEGRVKKATELVFGIVMIIAIISPLKALDFEVYSISAEKYKLRSEELVAEGNEARENLDRRIIERKYAAYILDKAEKSGVTPLAVNVQCRWSNDGYWYPSGVEITLASQSDEEKCIAVKSAVEAELGIDATHQIWRVE